MVTTEDKDDIWKKHQEWSKFYLELFKKFRPEYYKVPYDNGFTGYIRNGSSILKIGNGTDVVGFILGNGNFDSSVIQKDGEIHIMFLKDNSPEKLLFQIERIFYGAGEPLEMS